MNASHLARFSLIAVMLLATAGSAGAQIMFNDVADPSGLQFTTEYGPAFNLNGLPPDVAVQLEIIQRNMGNGAAVCDYDNDGDLDVYLLGGLGHQNVLFENTLETGSLAFVDATASAGVGNGGQSRVAQFADLDNDGWRDLILVNDSDSSGSYSPSAIYRNDHGTFTDVTAVSGFAPTGFIKGGLGVVDYDQDGRLDVFVTNWGALQSEGFTYTPGHNRLYRNLGGFQFQDVTSSVGLGMLESNSFSPIFADFDNDRDPDLYIPVDGYADVFYRNDGGVFVDATSQVGTNHVGTDMGVAVLDFDRDGDLDIFTTNVTHPEGLWGGNTLLVNKLVETGQLSFVDEAVARGVSNTGWGWGAEWIDANNSGSHELFAVNGFDEFVAVSQPPDVAAGLTDLRAFLFANDGSDHFVELVGSGADVVGDARAAIAFDADRDGLQDLLVTNIDDSVVLLHNDTVDAGNWLAVELTGSGPVNRDGVGARVLIKVGEETFLQEIIGGGSFLAGRPHELHFGLGDATVVDELRVIWPDGREVVAYDLAVNQLVTATVTSCDFSNDGLCNVADLDLMQAIGPIATGVPAAGNEEFDLNGDGVIDLQDRDEWLAIAATENELGSPYKLGDANLDGTVDGQDFLAWNGSKFTNNLLWSAGNFTGDEAVDGQDFIAWNQNKFTSSDGISAVPEPAAGMSLASLLLLLTAIRRR